MKWFGTHVLWILGLVQVVLAGAAGAADLFSPSTLKLIIFGGGLVTAVVGYIKANPPDVGVMLKMHWVTVILGVILFLTIAGCTTLGLASPKGFDQNLANAYGVHTAVVQATTQALQGGKISVADAKAVQGLEANARALLDTAKAAEVAGDAAGAQKNLALAMTALTALQSYINAHGGS